MTSVQAVAFTAALLALSNLFMTFAGYGHLKLFMGEPLRWNYLWAGLCLLGAVYFIFFG